MEKNKKFFERTVIYEDGRIEKIKVPKKEILKEIKKMLNN